MKKTILFTLLLILFLLPANFSQAAELIEINEQNFPSEALRDFAGKIDQNGDGKLSLEERNCVTEVSVMCGELDETLIQKEEYSFATIISTVNNKDVNAGEHMLQRGKMRHSHLEKKNGNNLKNECRFRKSRTCVLDVDINLIRLH